jgi:hypothetical protein
MMRRAAITLALFVSGWLLFIVLIHQACAAEIKLVDYGTQTVVTFEGDIVAGDLEERFGKVAEQGLSLGKPMAGIWFNSGGGQFGEAAKIADFLFSIREATADKPGVAAVVGFDQTCASACFLIFACAPRRLADSTAHIGVHSARNATDNREDAGSYAVDTAMARIAKQCGVPGYLIAKMVTTPADNMYWLTTLDLQAMGVNVSPSDHVLALPGYPGSERQAPRPQPPMVQAPTSSPTQYTGRLQLTDILTLRTGPDPRSEKVNVGPPLNDAIPRDATVKLRYTDLHAGCRRYDQTSSAHTIWCQLDYDGHMGWVNSFYLDTGDGRLSCLVDRTSFGCDPTPPLSAQPQSPLTPQKCGLGPRLQVAGCIASGYGPSYCLDLRQLLEEMGGCKW